MEDCKVALVTGAGRGIGRAIACKLASQGMLVIVNYNGSTAKAEETVATILANGGRAVSRRCNVADYSVVEEMVKEIVATYGRIDVLVNNAGITNDNLLMKMSSEDFEDVLSINLKGAFHCIKAVNRTMLKQRSGRIINISSISGIMGNAGQANYSASKAGVIGLTKSAARELASRGITVNAIAPGFVETDMTAGLSDKVKETAVEQIPLKRFGQPEEIAEAAAYFASDAAGYITGQVLAVDGGMSM